MIHPEIKISDIRDPYESPTFPLTIAEAQTILDALKYQYINREKDEAFYDILTSMARFVEKNK